MWVITATVPRPPAAIAVPSSNPGTITATEGALKKKKKQAVFSS